MNRQSNRPSYRLRNVRWDEESGRIRSLRETVFVSELRGPPDLVADPIDAADDTVHVLATDEAGQPVGAGRVAREVDVARIARMAVLGSWRAQGVGHAILSLLLAAATGWGAREVHLYAPLEARRFYARHGFREVGPEFVHGGVPNVEMRMSLA